MGIVEIEVWSTNRDADYARVLSGIDDDLSEELYRYLCSSANDWCEQNEVDPKVFRRTTGRHIQLADVLQWYTEEELLTKIDVDGKSAFLPVPEVQKSLEKPAMNRTLIEDDK